jgi:hypothetical protein
LEYAELAEKYGVELFAPLNEADGVLGLSILQEEGSPRGYEAASAWGQEILPGIRERYSRLPACSSLLLARLVYSWWPWLAGSWPPRPRPASGTRPPAALMIPSGCSTPTGPTATRRSCSPTPRAVPSTRSTPGLFWAYTNNGLKLLQLRFYKVAG